MNWLIIVCGGRGERMDLGFNKVFAVINKFPLIYWTLKTFENSKAIDAILLSARKEDIEKIEAQVKRHKFKKVKGIVEASDSRQSSTFAILKKFGSEMKGADLVGVHNAVNPFVSEEEIKEVYQSAKKHGAALLACPAKDTVKISDKRGLVLQTPLRQYSWYAQTPQVATYSNLRKAFEWASKKNFVGTDDTQLLEIIGVKAKIVPCSYKNIKITFREDLLLAREFLKTFF